jgi:hypothetical protein
VRRNGHFRGVVLIFNEQHLGPDVRGDLGLWRCNHPFEEWGGGKNNNGSRRRLGRSRNNRRHDQGSPRHRPRWVVVVVSFVIVQRMPPGPPHVGANLSSSARRRSVTKALVGKIRPSQRLRLLIATTVAVTAAIAAIHTTTRLC